VILRNQSPPRAYEPRWNTLLTTTALTSPAAVSQSPLDVDFSSGLVAPSVARAGSRLLPGCFQAWFPDQAMGPIQIDVVVT